MTPPAGPNRSEIDDVLDLVLREARAYLDSVDERPVLESYAADAARGFRRPLPEHGNGAAAALAELIEHGLPASGTSTGPRFFHWVTGGATPAALGADLLTAVLDQQAYSWIGSPLAVELELVALDWLKELFGLPPAWGGIMTTGASMANFVGLACARQWWGEGRGVDVAQEGLAGLPAMPILAGGYVHASAVKALALLGVGRSAIRTLASDDTGRLDLPELERTLRTIGGAPALILATAGEVNAGAFDPIADMAELARRHNAWLHVDGAFGLFARLSPRTAGLAAGVELADSVTVDGHKWLNVPFDSGYAFVRDRALMARAFAYTADYLPAPDDPRPTMGQYGPESSRRARSLAVWATLRAYGRSGYRALVERHLDLARELARLVERAPELELLEPPVLNVVCFRFAPPGRADHELDALNLRLADRIAEHGRFLVGTTRYRGRVAFRPTIINWRTGERDVEAFVSLVRELAAGLAAAPTD
jgi:glutamate/tyrosine decarboxylase-like PLP-dependent enzyme